MVNTKHLLIVVLVTFCLTATLFMITPTRSKTEIGTYDPWADLNGDGTVDIYDAITLANAFDSSGDPTRNVNVLSLYNSSWFGHYPPRTVSIFKDLNITFDWFLDIPTGVIDVEGFDKIYCILSIRLGWTASPVFGGYTVTGLIDGIEVIIPRESGDVAFSFVNGTVTMLANFPVCTPQINLTVSLNTDPYHFSNVALSLSLYLKN